MTFILGVICGWVSCGIVAFVVTLCESPWAWFKRQNKIMAKDYEDNWMDRQF